MELEKIARRYVQGLKALYVNVTVYAAVSFVCFVMWLSFGGAGFWPIWVFLGFGMATVLQGWTIGAIKQLEEILPFMKPEWEEQQLKKLLKSPVAAKIYHQGEKPDGKIKETSEPEQIRPINEEKPSPKQGKNVASKAINTSKAAPPKKPIKKKPVV